MAKKIFYLLTLSLMAFARDLIINNAQGTLHLNISKKDVNRLVFKYPITYKVYSKEKDLTLIVKGKELYVKFIPLTQEEVTTVKDKIVSNGNKKTIYKAEPAEIFVVTKEKTYSLVLHPKNVETTTIYFQEPLDEKKEKILKTLTKEEEYVSNLVGLITPILKNKNLQGFDIQNKNINLGYVELPRLNTKVSIVFNKLYKGYKNNVYTFTIKNLTELTYSIPDTRNILLKITQYINKNILAYSLFYGNRIYKILPKSSAKIVIVTDGEIK